VQGPESFVFNPDGSFYTGLSDGRIVHVWTSDACATSSEAHDTSTSSSSTGSTCSNLVEKPRYEVVARTGVEMAGCGALELEPTCGRPLGMRRLPSLKVIHDVEGCNWQWLGVEVQRQIASGTNHFLEELPFFLLTIN